MKILDCESVISTYQSIEQIFGVGRQVIDEFFGTIGPNLCYRGAHTSVRSSPDCFVLSELEGQLNRCVTYDGTCWFHLTRVHSSNTFQNGIKPLSKCIDLIWAFLFSLIDTEVSEKEWKAFRTGVETDCSNHYAQLYRSKIQNPILWGPYAMLIRDLGFEPQELGNHDYFAVPEIVEDICICCQEAFDVDLLHLFQQATKPCIVKFIHYEPSQEYIKAALFYLYLAFYDLGLPNGSPCFDGRGKAVPRECILKVDLPSYNVP